ncbi:hypothetical protein BV25DRAFT_1922312 [Artomyces pyxidatus]|uniref:Uncharacterized protein n=1 Tax=Artomyces pyxidatus TaxID=48021 RepID=A0ACB8SG17_9AGAM|nr:hypothetical protein BV25DRAFT_1922312 [Artomyces pyxidatus]
MPQSTEPRERPPGVTTRATNKDVHPGRVVQPKTRRSSTVVAKEREEKVRQAAEARKRQLELVARVARIENNTIEADLQEEQTADHPSGPHLRARHRSTATSAGSEHDAGNLEQSGPSEEMFNAFSAELAREAAVNGESEGDSGDEFLPEASGDEASDDEEDEGFVMDEDDEEAPAIQKPKKRQKSRPGRSDVVAQRASFATEGVRAGKRKATTAADDADNADELAPSAPHSTPSVSRSAIKKSKNLPTPQVGGLAKGWQAPTKTPRRHDSQEIESLGPSYQAGKAVRGTGKTPIRIVDGLTKVTPGAPANVHAATVPRAMRRQSQAKKVGKDGRSVKWNTKDIPANLQDRFTNVLIPVVRDFTGTLDPWASPTIEDMQRLFDTVFPDVGHQIEKGDVYHDLIMYRLGDWRAKFGSTALATMKSVINDPDNADIFGTEADIQDYAVHQLGSDGGKTAPMYWKTWNNGEQKSGRFQSDIILAVFTVHIAMTADVPERFRSQERPIGAFILSILAATRALTAYTTGTFQLPPGPDGFFSVDNWGDKIKLVDGQRKLIRKATKFVIPVKALTSIHWENIYQGAADFMPRSNRRRASPAASDPQELSDTGEASEGEVVYTMFSDPPQPPTMTEARDISTWMDNEKVTQYSANTADMVSNREDEEEEDEDGEDEDEEEEDEDGEDKDEEEWMGIGSNVVVSSEDV